MAEHLPLVSVARRDDGVAVVTIENPKVNALSSEVLRQLRAAAEALTDDPPGAVVITGGDRVFAAGADISEFGGPDEAREIGELFLHALNAVADIPRATIAAISRCRPRRRLRAGPGLRLPHRLRPGPARPARDPARHHPRRRRHPAAGPAGRARRRPRT